MGFLLWDDDSVSWLLFIRICLFDHAMEISFNNGWLVVCMIVLVEQQDSLCRMKHLGINDIESAVNKSLKQITYDRNGGWERDSNIDVRRDYLDSTRPPPQIIINHYPKHNIYNSCTLLTHFPCDSLQLPKITLKHHKLDLAARLIECPPSDSMRLRKRKHPT